MSITNTELRDVGNGRTGRSKSQAEIDVFVKSWVQDLSTRGVILDFEETVTLVDEQVKYLFSGFPNAATIMPKNIDVVTIIDANDKESGPFERINWARYKERVGQGTSPGKPSEYTDFNNALYIWSQPAVPEFTSLKVSGQYYHLESTTILYPDRYKECGYQYIIYKIYESLGYLHRKKTRAHLALYESELAKVMTSDSRRKAHAVRYTDI